MQFETIHPFLDGNGRVGRLLITLLLCAHGVLAEPLLYLSLYFKTHRQRYYSLLDSVRRDGDWEAWLTFFAEAVGQTANQAVDTARDLIDQSSRDRARVDAIGRAALSTRKVLDSFIERPIANSGWLTEKSGLSPATAFKALDRLQEWGIVRELTQRRRNRLFSYESYITILSRGTELPG